MPRAGLQAAPPLTLAGRAGIAGMWENWLQSRAGTRVRGGTGPATVLKPNSHSLEACTSTKVSNPGLVSVVHNFLFAS